MTLLRSPRWPGPVATALLVLALVPLVLRGALMAMPPSGYPMLAFRVMATAWFVGTLATWGLLVEAARREGTRAWRVPAALFAGALVLHAWAQLPVRVLDPQIVYPVRATLLDAVTNAAIALAIVTIVRSRGVRPGIPLIAWASLLVVSATVARYAAQQAFLAGPPEASLAWLPMLPSVLVTCVALRAIARLGWPHRALTASAAVLAFGGAAVVTFLSAASRAAFHAGNDPATWVPLAEFTSWGALALQVGLLLAALALTVTPPSHSPGTRGTPLEVRA